MNEFSRDDVRNGMTRAIREPTWMPNYDPGVIAQCFKDRRILAQWIALQQREIHNLHHQAAALNSQLEDQ